MSYHVGLKKHSADARAFSFIKILNLMQNMIYPPQMLFVENVVGFEVGVNFLKNSCWLLAFQHWISLICLWQVSDTHDQLLEVLSNLNFNTQEFILNPLQFGVPYSRPRYFCLVRTWVQAMSWHSDSSHFPLSFHLLVTSKLCNWVREDSGNTFIRIGKIWYLPKCFEKGITNDRELAWAFFRNKKLRVCFDLGQA